MKIVAITAGMGNPSTARTLSEVITQKLQDGHDFGDNNAFDSKTATVIIHELREYAVGIMHAMTGGFSNPELQKVINDVADADILVAITPVYKASMSGLFKSFFDILDENILEDKTVILGATGGSDRHSLVIDYAMRPMFSYMRARVMHTGIYASPGDWGNIGLTRRIEQVADEALNNGKPMFSRKEKAMETMDFEDMLANLKN